MKKIWSSTKRHLKKIDILFDKDWSSIIASWLNNKNVILSALSSIVTIVAGLAAFTLYSWQSYNDLTKQRDERFLGVWTNPSEGCIDCNLENDPERPIVLNLTVTDGKISGTMDASAWLANYRKEQDAKRKPLRKPKSKKEKMAQIQDEAVKILMERMHKDLMVAGELTFNHGFIVITDFHDGKRELFGIADISMEYGVMKMKMRGNHFLGIPDNADLYRTYNEDGKPCRKVEEQAPWVCLGEIK